MKGIILAGGSGTRLYPLTKVVSKQLLPVYNKPMIYYPLSILMLGGIRDILIISTRQDLPKFNELLGSGEALGIKLTYAIQEHPRGIAEAFIIGKNFIGNNPCTLILGDNIFYGDGISDKIKEANNNPGATIFLYKVSDPSEYGVATLDIDGRVIEIQEKPTHPKSDWAVTGLYHYDSDVVELVKSLAYSDRQELEITDLNNLYLKYKKLNTIFLGRGFAWLDTGTPDSLLEASQFVHTIEHRQGQPVCCPGEVAYKLGYISKEQLKKIAMNYNSVIYTNYLLSLVEEDDYAK
jgi:glucose-1-phosphate thymidylyltransferase